MNSHNLQSNIMAPIENLTRLGEIAKVDQNLAFQKIVLAAGLTSNHKLIEDTAKLLHPKVIYELFNPFPFKTPSEKILSPDFKNQRLLMLGQIMRDGSPFAYPVDLLAQHAALFGASGTGKTNLIYGLILQCMRLGVSVLIFDKDKQDYRHLRRFDPSLKVIDARRLEFNPMEPPPNVSLDHWKVIFTAVFCKSNSLLDGSESLLLTALDELYLEYLEIGKWPTLYDLKDKIASYNLRGNYRASGYQASLLNRLDSYLSLGKNMFSYSKGVPVDYLSRQNIVIEVKALTDRISRFFMNIILYGIFLYKIGSGQRGNTIQNAVFVDEAKWLAPPGHSDPLGFSPLSSILSMAREAGIGLIIADQTANLDEAVFVNSRIKCCFRLGNGTDIERVRKAMSLDQDQAEYISRLGTGECIIRIPREDPFVVKTMKVNFQ